MSYFTKEELIKIFSWGIDRAESVGIQNFYEEGSTPIYLKIESMINNYRDPNCIHKIDKELKACSLCGLSSKDIPCIGGWL